MKIAKHEDVRPTDFDDDVLNATFGKILGRLSDEAAHAIAFRHTEIRVAKAVRKSWEDHAAFIGKSGTPNGETGEQLRTNPGWSSVRDEALEFLRADQADLDNEEILARAHIALCDKVIQQLKDSLDSTALTCDYGADGQRTASALRYLRGSADAYYRAQDRIGDANTAWDARLEAFAAEAEARNTFASGPGAVQLAQIDALSADAFELQIAALLERDGCEIVRRHGGANDQGADIIALTPDGLRIVLQCKHSTKIKNRVDPRYVHELNGTARPEHGADIAGMVTNRTLSAAAEHFATKHGIHVIDRPVLRRWATFGVSWIPEDRREFAAV